jgi:hypothetical protein
MVLITLPSKATKRTRRVQIVVSATKIRALAGALIQMEMCSRGVMAMETLEIAEIVVTQ